MPDGRPQTSVVWCDFDGTHVRLNCMRHFRKTENMRRDPRVTLLCYDPRRPLRYLEIRGTVASMTEDDAPAHLDALASAYMRRPAIYFGDCVAAELAATETPVLFRDRADPCRDARCRGRPDRRVPTRPSRAVVRP